MLSETEQEILDLTRRVYEAGEEAAAKLDALPGTFDASERTQIHGELFRTLEPLVERLIELQGAPIII